MRIRWLFESRRVAASALSIAVLATLAAGSAGAATAVVEPSGGKWRTTYEVTLYDGTSDLENIILLTEPSDNEGGLSAAHRSYWVQGDADSVITVDFPASLFEPGWGLNLGVMTDSEGDHLVLMMGEEVADFAMGQEWSTLFGDTREDDLIAALRSSDSDATDLLASFGSNEAKNILDNDQTVSAWFRIDGAFKIVAFSSGELIGTGISRQQFLPAAAVPEPASLALAGLGVLGVLAFERNRRRRAG